MENNKGLQKKYGLLTAICMVVGIVIGSGVFFKAQTILNKTQGNMPLGILAWVIGGVIMLACILAFSVMATKYEKVNGVVDYAEATVGPKYGYLVGWFMTIIYYPTLTSALAWLSARYTLTFVQSAFGANSVYIAGLNPVTGAECMALTLLFLVAAYAVNALSPKLAGYFQVTTTVIKMVPLLLMAVVGIIVGVATKDQYLVSNFATTTAAGATSNPLFAAVVATAFAYEGWIIATSINAELKNSKKNLPIALVVGGLIVVVVYIIYYVGVAGGASVKDLQEKGATVAFTNVFGTTFGSILNVFVAISCMGTMNGLMLGCTRGMYSIAVRKKGFASETFAEIGEKTNMPTNSSILGLLLCAVWMVFFYGANLADKNWFGVFGFDSTELPIVTIYAMYIPIFIMFMAKAKDEKALKRIVLPLLAICGCLFMIAAAVYAHGVQPFQTAKETGSFACPIVFYLIIFAVIMAIGMIPMFKKEK